MYFIDWDMIRRGSMNKYEWLNTIEWISIGMIITEIIVWLN